MTPTGEELARHRTMTDCAVLAVDDEPDIRLLIELLLRQEGYLVQTAATGEEALAAIEHAPPDLVLLDIFLPGMSGWQVAERLRDAGLLPGLPVLMLSAHTDPGAPNRAADLGCRGFVAKPFDPDSLVHAVRDALPSQHGSGTA